MNDDIDLIDDQGDGGPLRFIGANGVLSIVARRTSTCLIGVTGIGGSLTRAVGAEAILVDRGDGLI